MNGFVRFWHRADKGHFPVAHTQLEFVCYNGIDDKIFQFKMGGLLQREWGEKTRASDPCGTFLF